MRHSHYAAARRASAAIVGALCAAATALAALAASAGAAELVTQRIANLYQPAVISRSTTVLTRKALATTSSQPVVYVSQTAANHILVYPTGTAIAATQPIETIAGLNGPAALAVDSIGDLYVVETTVNDIKVFAPGKLMPSRTLGALPGAAPFNGVAVDAQGTVFASQAYGGVCVFKSGSTVPSAVLSDASAPYPLGVAVDGADNVFVTYVSPASANFTNQVGVFAASTSVGIGLFHQLPLTYGAASTPVQPQPSGVGIDANGNLLAYNYATGQLGVYPRAINAPGASLTIAPIVTGPFFALTSGNHHLYVAYDNVGVVAEFAFPSGSLQQSISLPASAPYSSGIATSPPSPQGAW